MSRFEDIFVKKYIKDHAASLLKENQKLISDIGNDLDPTLDPNTFAQDQLEFAVRDRLIYLAVQEYHNCLSRFLADNGISLPDLDTLVEKYHED